LPYQATLLVVAAIYLPLVIAVGYLLCRVDDIWLGWVNPFVARLTRADPV
jgi:hypothetical protein